MDKNKIILENIEEICETKCIKFLNIEVRKSGKNKIKYVQYECLKDGYVGWKPLNDILSHKGCPICGGKVLWDGNRLSLIRPDLIKYLVNPEDGYNHTVSSNKRISVKCPECGMIKPKQVIVNALSTDGFSCNYCSDGISIPEKFGIHLFKQLNLKIEVQKSFTWSKRKRYDFYTGNKIIEIHGEQHYVESPMILRSLSDENSNDLLKYNLAIKNGIKPEDYIIVDCRKSNLDWLKTNYIKSLNSHFDLSDINWLDIWEKSQKSLVIEVCEKWKNDNVSISYLVKQFKISNNTVTTYLKRGTEIGLCEYKPKGKKDI